MSPAANQAARRRLPAAGLALLWLALVAAPVGAKSFVFTDVVIEAGVGRDGSLAITEARTYRFDGSYTWASYRLLLRGASGIREIRVADERGPYAWASRSASPPQPGTFQASPDGDTMEIRWGFRAANESRTFRIAYLLDDVVTVYQDIAEVYWKFIGTGWDRSSKNVRVTMRLPGQVPADQIRVWMHAPLHGEVRRTDGGAVLTIRNLPPATMVEGRILFPREVVPGARVHKAESAVPRILRQEGAWADQANRARLRLRLLAGGLSALPLLAIGGWLYLYMRFGREPVPAPPEGYYRELPGDYSPAELGVLWRFGSVQPADFTATILDLVRRGYLTVETASEGGLIFHDETYTLTRTKKADGLRPFESEGLAILFGQARATGERVTISKRKGLPPETKLRMGRRFTTWSGMVSGAARAYGFFDPTSMTMRWVALVLGVFVAIGGIWAALAVGAAGGLGSIMIAGVATGISGFVLSFGSGAVMRRSQRGADDLRRWQGFRRFLLDFSEMQRAELPALTLWEQYLVYAVPLGVADRVIAQLKKIYPAEELARSPGLQSWVSSSGSGHGDALASFSSFTTAFAAATSSASSGSGGGGGASGGGGGGGGGSGGSAG